MAPKSVVPPCTTDDHHRTQDSVGVICNQLLVGDFLALSKTIYFTKMVNFCIEHHALLFVRRRSKNNAAPFTVVTQHRARFTLTSKYGCR
eukprot:scaffold52170_cov63-Phaeocystis_antarctica.AAC.6